MEHAAALAAPAVPVPFFTQAAALESVWPLVEANVTDVVDQGRYSLGHMVERLEHAIAERACAAHVVGVGSGADALVLLLRAVGLEPGEDVVVPAFGFIATASSVVLAGGRPVFADIGPDDYALDPAAAEAAVTDRTRVLLPAHLFHQLADLAGLAEVADRHALSLVEDSAEAIGMRWAGTHAGLAGSGGVLSFFPTRTLGALGDAGAIVTDDDQIAATAAALRRHGRFGRTLARFPGIAAETVLPGLNSKMDDFQAAVLLAKLTRLDAEIARRAQLAGAYTERLADCPGVRKTPVLLDRGVPTEPVFSTYLVEVERRDALAAHLAAHGVGTETRYPVPTHLQPCFAHLGHRAGEFPVAEAACAHAIALPLYPDLPDAAVDRVCDLVRGFYAGARR